MVMMARAPKAKRICACCGPTTANTPSDEPTVKLAAFGNNVTRLAGTSLGRVLELSRQFKVGGEIV
jgi:hypothetical protein